MTAETRNGFPNPFEVAIPSACEGWQGFYPYHAVFAEERRGFEEGRFWFQDGLHFPEAYHPFDAGVLDAIYVAFSQTNARLFVVPPSFGCEYRILNGYAYCSLSSVTDAGEIARRAALFQRRAGHYYEHWDELYERWVDKVTEETRELQELVVPELPDVEDEAVVVEGRGWCSSHALLVAYDRLLEGVDRVLQYHFELLNLGYVAYFAFYELCRENFPELPEQTIARMVAGIDVLVLRPDEELRRLARLAIELGLAERLKACDGEEQLLATLSDDDAGRRWLADYEATKDPWFYFSYGTGVYHHHRSWIDDPTLPIRTIASYVRRLEAGEDVSRPVEAVLVERERLATEHRALLPEGACQTFDDSLTLARAVYPYVENHNFYVDHRYLTIFWNKAREFGALLSRHGFLVDAEDMFLLRPDEVRAALEELRMHWSSGSAGVARGPSYWPPIVEKREAIYEAMREWNPPPALGEVPGAVVDASAVMLFGITTERVQEWLRSPADAAAGNTLAGLAASPGMAEGRARVILRPEELAQLEQGEILVAPSTSTSWTPVFGRIAGAVLDTGGIMCHAAIVAREYGLPTVVGTGTGTKRIKTGDRIHVDANTGLVTILD